MGVLGAIQVFSPLVLLREFNPELYLDLIEQEKVYYTMAVPTMLLGLLESQARKERDVSSLRVVGSGGSVVPIEVVNRVRDVFGVDFSIVFGQTETSPLISGTRLNDPPEDAASSIGTALPHVEVKIVGADDGKTLPIGQVGEICTRGYLTMLCYFQMAEATRKTVDSEGWLHTGDLGLMDERGFIYIKGRLKDMIIRGGENIYPREIEDVLYLHPSVGDVAVVGIPDEKFGEQVAAVLRPAPGVSSLDPNQLQAFCRQHLAAYKVPRFWFTLSEFPLTPSGKVQKFVLVEMIVTRQLSPLQSSIQAHL